MCPKRKKSCWRPHPEYLKSDFCWWKCSAKLQVLGSTKQRHLFHFDMSLKGRGRFIQRPIFRVTHGNHRTLKTTLFNERVHWMHSMGLLVISSIELRPFIPEFNAMIPRSSQLQVNTLKSKYILLFSTTPFSKY